MSERFVDLRHPWLLREHLTHDHWAIAFEGRLGAGNDQVLGALHVDLDEIDTGYATLLHEGVHRGHVNVLLLDPGVARVGQQRCLERVHPGLPGDVERDPPGNVGETTLVENDVLQAVQLHVAPEPFEDRGDRLESVDGRPGAGGGGEQRVVANVGPDIEERRALGGHQAQRPGRLGLPAAHTVPENKIADGVFAV